MMKKAIEKLYRAMKWGHQRQMFQQIQGGVYIPRATMSSLAAWSKTLTTIYNADVRGAVADFMSIDWEVLELIFHDGFTNAQKYGHPKRSPWVELSTQCSPGYLTDSPTLVVRVCNMAHPQSPDITPEVASGFLHGGKGAAPQPSDSERLRTLSIDARDERLRTSDGIGMANARKATRAVRGHLRLYQNACEDGRITTFEIRVPFENVSIPDSSECVSEVAAKSSSDVAIGENEPQERRSVELGPPLLEALGQANEPVMRQSGMLQALPRQQEAPPTSTSSPGLVNTDPSVTLPALKCVSLDDSGMLLKTYQRMLHKKHLCASESIVIGVTSEEVDAAVDVIMGRKMKDPVTHKIVPVIGEHMAADIATLDYHLGHRLTGADIAAALHEEHFEGLTCIFSGGSEEDMAAYLEMPGVDMVVSKAVKNDVVAGMLKEKYRTKKSRRTTSSLQ
jgi:hypothetical protein